MKFPLILLISFLPFLTNPLVAQVDKKIYQTMDIGDSTKQINFDFSEGFDIVFWKQESKIMFETAAHVEINSREIVNKLVADGRYTLISDNNGTVKTIKFISRIPIKGVQGNVLNESLFTRVYIPEDFIVKNSVAYKTDNLILVESKK